MTSKRELCGMCFRENRKTAVLFRLSEEKNPDIVEQVKFIFREKPYKVMPEKVCHHCWYQLKTMHETRKQWLENMKEAVSDDDDYDDDDDDDDDDDIVFLAEIPHNSPSSTSQVCRSIMKTGVNGQRTQEQERLSQSLDTSQSRQSTPRGRRHVLFNGPSFSCTLSGIGPEVVDEQLGIVGYYMPDTK